MTWADFQRLLRPYSVKSLVTALFLAVSGSINLHHGPVGAENPSVQFTQRVDTRG